MVNLCNIFPGPVARIKFDAFQTADSPCPALSETHAERGCQLFHYSFVYFFTFLLPAR